MFRFDWKIITRDEGENCAPCMCVGAIAMDRKEGQKEGKGTAKSPDDRFSRSHSDDAAAVADVMRLRRICER